MHSDWLRPDWELPHVRAFMTTRAGGVSDGAYASMNVGRSVHDAPERVAANRALVSQALQARAVFMPQVHGAAVLRLRPEHAEAGVEVPAADASISTVPGLACAIQVADCLPVLFAAGVLEHTVQALCEASGCAPRDLHAWLGACIGPQAFEVGADVLAAFGADPARPDPRYFVYRPNQAGEPRWRADLVALARTRLQTAGVAHISGGGWCTYGEASRFFSYRRTRLSGRMVAAISLR